MTYITRYASPLGQLTLAGDGENLSALWLEGQKYFGAGVEGECRERGDLPAFHAGRKWLDAYFAGKRPEIRALKLAPQGGEFRRAVWDILCDIPYGECLTYGEIARKMALRLHKPGMSSQAVGGAVGHNPLSIIIPCHRVVGTNGSLTGYAGGIDKKILLLKHEGVEVSRYFVPKKGTAL